MAKVDSLWLRWAPRLLSILRIITAFLFMQHGAQKIFGLLGGSRGGQPQFLEQSWIGGVLEFDHQLPVGLRRLASDPRAVDREHIHTVVRTPNGNDYGKDLLRQHYMQHPHPHSH